jgi:hypothetical protein
MRSRRQSSEALGIVEIKIYCTPRSHRHLFELPGLCSATRQKINILSIVPQEGVCASCLCMREHPSLRPSASMACARASRLTRRFKEPNKRKVSSIHVEGVRISR